jgi:acyl dehydratase
MPDQPTAARITVGDELPPLRVPVTARTIVMGASASRDWQPQHHDHEWAVRRSGTGGIFLNTPAQAGWIERFLTDWSGPRGRLGRMEFRMRRSVRPGDELCFTGVVRSLAQDGTGCWWARVDVELSVDGERVTSCAANLAVPATDDDNPWAREGAAWRPLPVPATGGGTHVSRSDPYR